jgi:FAD/FMN-containing dehydrogenase/Fe-S oxidoreductase
MPNSLVELAQAAKSAPAEIGGLAEALRARLSRHGDYEDGNVRFDRSTRALYATDGSNYRQIPIGVVFPRSNEDVWAALEVCRQFGAPVLSRGGGTSLAGQCCNVAVILDFSRHMNGILEIDPARRIARVQPGVILDKLRSAAEKHQLTFGPDPASHDRCTLGGMIGNNSCGVHSVMAGKTDENIEALEVLTYDGVRMKVGATTPEELERIIGEGGRRGEIYGRLKSIAESYAGQIRQRFPNIPRRVSGYNLNYVLPENHCNVARALVGSEGTCVTVLEATCRLVESPPERVLVVAGFPDIFHCADRIPEVLTYGPIGLEGFDDMLVDYTRRKGINTEGLAMLPPGGGWLLVEFGGWSAAEADSKARNFMQAMGRAANSPHMHIFPDRVQAKKVWEVRESSLGVTSYVRGEPMSWEGWEDSAVDPVKLGSYLRDLRRLMGQFGYRGSLYGHFGHACVHTRLDFDLRTTEGIARFRSFMQEAADLVVGYGGSISGEHGDGQARAELLPKMFGPELIEAFGEFKAAWDPAWKMNPGKLIEPYRLDENLRQGPSYAPWQPKTRFQFPDDDGSMAQSTLRCVGVGKCRRDEGGVMCPSYRVTREEEHSTRGRAHLLWEMVQGEVIQDGWRSQEVKHSLDLCLACKGCKSDCPVAVDMATYKAEFLSHYYQGRVRPRSAYAFGNVDLWASAATHVAGIANLTTQLPILRDLAKLAAGVAPQRRLPALAPENFKKWFRKRARQRRGPPVLLWPDTFNNYFLPSTAKAAVDVLEAAGFSVIVPRKNLCCGRPLYDFGMLDRAEALLLEIMDELAPEIAAGVPVVGLEPSCVAVFRDELRNLFPRDERARALSQQTFLFSEFLEMHAKDFAWPQWPRTALVHGHCHHKSILKMGTDQSVLKRLGIDSHTPAPGCCGMAGSFGFEHDKYEVSLAIGELELLPAVRNAPAEWLIIADGFSCREQIAQGSQRQALHLAEVLAMALRAPSGAGEAFPEAHLVRERQAEVGASMIRAGLGLAGLAAAGLLLWTVPKKS